MPSDSSQGAQFDATTPPVSQISSGWPFFFCLGIPVGTALHVHHCDRACVQKISFFLSFCTYNETLVFKFVFTRRIGSPPFAGLRGQNPRGSSYELSLQALVRCHLGVCSGCVCESKILIVWLYCFRRNCTYRTGRCYSQDSAAVHRDPGRNRLTANTGAQLLYNVTLLLQSHATADLGQTRCYYSELVYHWCAPFSL